MSTVAAPPVVRSAEIAAAGSLARVIDRWIFVLMATWFIAIVLAGFIPDSLMKIAQVRAGQRAPFPLMLHAHAVLMGSFLLLLLTQSTLVAVGRRAFHRTLGLAGMVLAPAMDGGMFDAAATRENLARLNSQGITIIGPAEGHLASGLSGKGRMIEPAEILGHIRVALGKNRILSGKKIVVTAGGVCVVVDGALAALLLVAGLLGHGRSLASAL